MRKSSETGIEVVRITDSGNTLTLTHLKLVLGNSTISILVNFLKLSNYHMWLHRTISWAATDIGDPCSGQLFSVATWSNFCAAQGLITEAIVPSHVVFLE